MSVAGLGRFVLFLSWLKQPLLPRGREVLHLEQRCVLAAWVWCPQNCAEFSSAAAHAPAGRPEGFAG